MKIYIQKLDEEVILPTYGTEGSAGLDIAACLKQNIELPTHGRILVGTGIAMQIPKGYLGMICSRSGLAIKYGVAVLNSPGIIDSDYRGEIKVILINHSEREFIIEHGMRIAQIIVMPYEKNYLQWQVDLEETKRGETGFGSTGI